MSQKQQTGFMESKTIIAIILVGLSWLAWQAYMKKKYPHIYEKKVIVEQTQQKTRGVQPKTLKVQKIHLSQHLQKK